MSFSNMFRYVCTIFILLKLAAADSPFLLQASKCHLLQLVAQVLRHKIFGDFTKSDLRSLLKPRFLYNLCKPVLVRQAMYV